MMRSTRPTDLALVSPLSLKPPGPGVDSSPGRCCSDPVGESQTAHSPVMLPGERFAQHRHLCAAGEPDAPEPWSGASGSTVNLNKFTACLGTHAQIHQTSGSAAVHSGARRAWVPAFSMS